MATIRPALPADVPELTQFLARSLRGEGGPARYRKFLEYRWLADKPDLGVVIEDGGVLHGFIGAIYADRDVDGTPHRFCNLTSIAVDESHRKLTLQLFGALLGRKELTFTCFSASDRIAKILDFFKFQHVASTKIVVGPISGLSALARASRVRITTDRARLDRELDPGERTIARDHASYRCGQLLVREGERRCYAVTVRRGRGLRAFADVLYASDPELLVRCLPWVNAALVLRHGTVLTGIDQRWVTDPPRLSFAYAKLRPVYARSPVVPIERIDGLYSELVPMYG